MPPKKTAGAAAKSAPKTKAKPDKKTAEKENPDAEEKVVPEKKVKQKTAVKKAAEPKEKKTKVDEKEEQVPVKQTRKATAAKVAKVAEVAEEETSAAPEKKEKEAKTDKVTRRKKVKDEDSEKLSEGIKEPPETKKKIVATRAKRGKKADVAEKEEESDETESQQAEEEAAESKKGRKRKAAPKEVKSETKKDEPANKATKQNATSTDWEKIDFKCSTKSSKGKTPNFHITSWNVDGLRAWYKKGGLDILEHDQPDVFCIQETKCSTEKLPEEIADIEGYETLWCCSDKEGYAGVGIVTKIKPLSVTYGIDSEEHDIEGRCITAEYEKFFLVNVYVPNAGRKLVTLPKRLEWNNLFKTYIKQLDKKKPVIICGDMNVAHEEVDLANPKANNKNAGFSPEEREGLTDFLEDGYVDTFRQLYPDKEKAYTFWTYMSNSRAKNVGWRLDYFIVSERFMENVCDNMIFSDVLGSDHCPVALHINI